MYLEFRHGYEKWTLIKAEDLPQHVKIRDFHVTWQLYASETLRHLGPSFGDWTFDFDHAGDLDVARQDCQKVYQLLLDYKVNPANIKLFFSGNKGYHLKLDYRAYMDKPEYDLHLICKELYRHLEKIIKPEKAKKSTMDQQIYAIRKTMRHPNTIHPKSGLYCIPITPDELNLPMDQIRELAKTQRVVETTPVADPALCKLFEDSKTAYYKSIENFEKRAVLIKEYTGKSYPPCIENILENGIAEGQRNYLIYCIARFLKKLKKEDEVYQIIEEFASRINYPAASAKASAKSALNREGAFLSCSTFADFCDRGKCNIFTKKESAAHWEKVNSVFNSYTYQEAINLYDTACKEGYFDRALNSGIKLLDAKTKLVKDTVLIIGSLSNVGKTSMAVTLVKNNPGKKFLYLPIEEGLHRTTRRFLGAKIDTGADVLIKTAKLSTVTQDDLYSLAFCHSDYDGLIIDQMVNLDAMAAEERLKYKKLMESFRWIARDFKMPVIALHQLSREAVKHEEPFKELLAESADVERLAYDIWLIYTRKFDKKKYHLLKADKSKEGPSGLIMPVQLDTNSKTFVNYDDYMPADVCEGLNIDFETLYRKEGKPEPVAERLPLTFTDASCPF